MERIPVYLFSGFLESGKTHFIRDLLADPNFNDGEASLLIVCEEGIEEYEEDELRAWNTVMETIDDPKRVTPNILKRLEQKHKPDRILIELNGMWQLEPVVSAFPARWELYQIVTIVDATTFELYSQNIGPMMFEHISTADLVVFNRCTDELKQMLYDKSINAMNPRAAIYLDDVDGNSEDYAKHLPLPFDMDADIIDIGAEDYGLWYLDATSDPNKYDGKTVRFLAQVYNGKNAPKGSFVPGRFGMVCCADDISFLGFVCRYPQASELTSREWVRVTASITVEELPQYRGEGPVLHAVEVIPADKPDEDLVYFN